MNNKTFKTILIFLFSLVVITILINLNIGFIKLGLADFIDAKCSEFSNCRTQNESCFSDVSSRYVSIPTSGFLLQEYFQNPLAGPSVLGITSVASLSVAFISFFSQDFTLPEFCKMVSSVFLQFWKAFLMSILLIFF